MHTVPNETHCDQLARQWHRLHQLWQSGLNELESPDLAEPAHPVLH